jgi:hypothetical protein
VTCLACDYIVVVVVVVVVVADDSLVLLGRQRACCLKTTPSWCYKLLWFVTAAYVCQKTHEKARSIVGLAKKQASIEDSCVWMLARVGWFLPLGGYVAAAGTYMLHARTRPASVAEKMLDLANKVEDNNHFFSAVCWEDAMREQLPCCS